jgi:hypothetical protein
MQTFSVYRSDLVVLYRKFPYNVPLRGNISKVSVQSAVILFYLLMNIN